MDYKAIIAEARSAATAVRGYSTASGCGRVYVEINKAGMNPKLRNAIKGAGYLMTERPYRTGKNRIYVGYDNATGREFAQGEAIAKVLNAAGIACYCDGDGD